MGRIKIADLPEDHKISRDEMRKVIGGNLAALMSGIETDLSTIGDDAQLANVDLQNWLQKQQQTMQMMSQISKQLHDTSLAIIRKMG